MLVTRAQRGLNLGGAAHCFHRARKLGEYRVTVAVTGKGYYDGEKPEKSLIPAKYAKPDTTGLIAMTKDAPNDVKLELESK